MEIIIDGVVYVPKEKPKEEYPIFKVDSEGVIIKLTSDKYEIMLDYASENIGNCFNITNQIKEYKPIHYNKEKRLYHKQPVWSWDKKYDKCFKSIRFYNAIDDKLFSVDGNRNNSLIYSGMEPITQDQLKVMPFIFEMYKKLKD